MMGARNATLIKFTAFAAVMAVLTAFLFFIFGQYRTGATQGYSAVFTDVSRLKAGDSVRFVGIRVGTVNSVALRPDKKVLVTFDADSTLTVTEGTRAAVRYLNLVGDRYLDLVDGPGATRALPSGSQIAADHTSPALDLDLLLGGLKPVTQGLNPKDLNALTASLIQIFQGQGGRLESLFSKTSSFTSTLADNGQTVQQLIDNLKTVVATLAEDGRDFSGTVDRLERLTTALAADRNPIGDAIQAIETGTASIADLLTRARPPLAGTVDQLSRLAPLLDLDKDRLDGQLQLLPEDYRKMARLGAYGSFLPVYLCGISFRATDFQGRTVVSPWVKQETGRCAEPDA
jgi:phospholipid/cholesterol/gamma-HCH transport system substrate-binding protein